MAKKKVTDNINKSKCECGVKLNYAITPFMTNEKRVCRTCGRIHYVDTAPIDWSKNLCRSQRRNENLEV